MRGPQFLALSTFLAVACAAGAAQAQTQTGLTYEQVLQPQAVQLVQQRLRQDGFYNGAIDGVWGADSRIALQRFQQSHQLQVTGELNQATAATLGLNPDALVAPQTAANAPAEAGTMLRPAAVRAIQMRLRALGYYNGPLDGLWGASTQAAIQQFQQGRGLQASGQINPATLGALGLTPEMLATR